MRAPRRLFPLLFLLLTACGGTRNAGRPAEERTTVRVENRSWSDVTVYVLRSSQRIRLGTVSGTTTRVLTIPETLIFGTTPLRFLADPIGSGQTPISQEIAVRPGDEVQMIIPNL